MVKAPRQTPTSDPLSDDRLVDAALAVIDDEGWPGTTLEAVAARLAVPAARVLARVPTRPELLRLIFRTIDQRMLADVTAADEMEPHRDRLFDLVMRRLEVLAPHKRAVESLMRDTWRDPAVSVILLCELRRSYGLTLEAAGISTRGPWGELRAQVFGALYARVLKTWRDDETADLSHTMKALDKSLDQAERAEHFACALVPRRKRSQGRVREESETESTPPPGGTQPPGPEPA